jgi:hypothetical protein
MGFQSGVPGDYDNYQNIFNYLKLENISLSSIRAEKGWIYLNQAFGIIGSFPLLIFCISLVQYLILAKFVNLYTDNRFRFIAGLIFYFSLNMMLFQMKGLRQGLAVDLCVASMICLANNKFLWSALIAFIACFMHTSTLLFIPFIILYILIKDSFFLNRKIFGKGFSFPILVTMAYLILYFSKKALIQYIQPLLLDMDLLGW